MKKLIVLFVLLSLPALGVISKPFGADFDNTGTLRTQDPIDINVKFTSAVAANELQVWDSTAADGATVDTSDSESAAVGDKVACVSVATKAAGKVGKCRVYGKMTLRFAHSGNGGDNLDATFNEEVYLAGPTAGRGMVAGIISPSTSSPLDHPIGVALEAKTATGDIKVFINLL